MSTEQPHYHGHRQRLRQRFDEGSIQAISDYELVELLLFLGLPRGDVKPLAKNLLARFGSLSAIVSADEKLLLEVSGVGPMLVHLFKLIHAASLKLLQQNIVNKPVLSHWQQVLDYCSACMAYDQREQLRLLFLDNKNQLIADEVQQTGTVNHTPLYPREVIKRALDLGASAIIMVHNHPSGDPTPSESDVVTTKQVFEAGKSLGIALHDHLIIGKNKHASLKSLGLF